MWGKSCVNIILFYDLLTLETFSHVEFFRYIHEYVQECGIKSLIYIGMLIIILKSFWIVTDIKKYFIVSNYCLMIYQSVLYSKLT